MDFKDLHIIGTINNKTKEKLSNYKIRQEAAYNEWLITKTKRLEIAIKHKTSPKLLTKYILAKGHDLSSFNYNIFDLIDTEEKAYWLGFLFADGSVSSKRMEVELSLKSSDSTHLEKFKKFISSTNKVSVNNIRCRIVLNNQHFKERLVSLGCTSKKSLTVKFPEIEENLLRHFIRGVFDGDGSITRHSKDSLWNSASFSSGSEIFLVYILDILKKYTSINTEQKIFKSKSSNIKLIVFFANNFSKVMNWLYNDCNIYLDRKYERYKNSIAVLLRD